jgi:isopenicillin-N N-acyltransferase-like protein
VEIPIVQLEGSRRDQGRRHGSVLREAIERNIALYLRRFEDEAGLPHPEVLRRAALYGEAIARTSPRYFEELAGVAEGSGLPLDHITMLTVRYELLYDRFSRVHATPHAPSERDHGPRQTPDGCTAFAVLPERSTDGHLRLGQNWDWIPGVETAFLSRRQSDGLTILALTEAGIPGGKIGLNSRGLGLAINGLNSSSDDWSSLRKPFHVRCDEALRSLDLDEALCALAGARRSCSTNYLVAQAPNAAVDLETAPDSEKLLSCDDGVLVHTNHFFDPKSLGIEQRAEDLHPRTRERRERMLSLLATRERVAGGDLEAFLCDHDGHPSSICQHPDPALPESERYATLVSIVMDLTALEMSACAGAPCSGRFETIRLSG